MTTTLTISIDQLFRAQPGGIGTYVRGLVQGLAELDDGSLEVLGLAPRGVASNDVQRLGLRRVNAHVPVSVLTRVWATWPLGVPRRSTIVHATSMAGPFAGGRGECVHSVAMHDMLWRDEPSAATPAGIRFHERRLDLIRSRESLRVFTSSPGLDDRLVETGIDRSRIHPVRLGVDDDGVEGADAATVASLLAEHGVVGTFSLYVGTREPRKNLERLIAAHSRARSSGAPLGPLVLVGPGGWGEVDSADATVLGLVSRANLKGLYRDATVFAYVPRAEGWGLPPVEALYAGTRVVASTTTPSVRDNPHVVIVDPLDADSIAHGLVTATTSGDDESSRRRRRGSVAHLTWRNVALDHLAGWR